MKNRVTYGKSFVQAVAHTDGIAIESHRGIEQVIPYDAPREQGRDVFEHLAVELCHCEWVPSNLVASGGWHCIGPGGQEVIFDPSVLTATYGAWS